MRWSHAQNTRKSVSRFLPQCESLERRDCPAVFMLVDGPLLTVIGDRAANTITLNDDGAGNISVVGDGRTLNATGIRTINVRTEGGNDNLTYTLTGALAGARRVSLDMGKDNDTARLDLTKGVASGSLAAQLQGNDGVDTLLADVGTLVEGTRADIQVNGGKGDDAIGVVFAGLLNGSLALKGSGQDGNDTVTGAVTLETGSKGWLDTSVRGGTGNDRLTLRVSENASSLTFREATLDGDEGIDTFTATPNVRVRNCEIRA